MKHSKIKNDKEINATKEDHFERMILLFINGLKIDS